MSGKKGIVFLRHVLSRNEHIVLMSLIGMVHQTIGISKKHIKTERQFWEPIEKIHGIKQIDGEDFFASVSRVRKQINKLSSSERRAARDAVYGGNLKFPPARASKARKAKSPKTNGRSPKWAQKDKFYSSWEWRTLRMEVLKEFGRACQCCGATPKQKSVSGQPVRIVVDHIKPISKFWHLRLDRTNLQVLCDECNQGKGAWDETDYRPEPIPNEDDPLTEEYRAIMEDDTVVPFPSRGAA